jgi:hypothetical protein
VQNPVRKQCSNLCDICLLPDSSLVVSGLIRALRLNGFVAIPTGEKIGGHTAPAAIHLIAPFATGVGSVETKPTLAIRLRF